MIREEYLMLTGGHCAAALLSLFEYWANGLLAKPEEAQRSPEVGPIQATTDEMGERVLDIYGKDKILDALKNLVGGGYLRKQKLTNGNRKGDLYWLQTRFLNQQLELLEEARQAGQQGANSQLPLPVGKSTGRKIDQSETRDLPLGGGVDKSTADQNPVHIQVLRKEEEREGPAPTNLIDFHAWTPEPLMDFLQANWPDKNRLWAAWRRHVLEKCTSPEIEQEIRAGFVQEKLSKDWLDGIVPNLANWLAQERWKCPGKPPQAKGSKVSPFDEALRLARAKGNQ